MQQNFAEKIHAHPAQLQVLFQIVLDVPHQTQHPLGLFSKVFGVKILLEMILTQSPDFSILSSRLAGEGVGCMNICK